MQFLFQIVGSKIPGGVLQYAPQFLLGALDELLQFFRCFMQRWRLRHLQWIKIILVSRPSLEQPSTDQTSESRSSRTPEHLWPGQHPEPNRIREMRGALVRLVLYMLASCISECEKWGKINYHLILVGEMQQCMRRYKWKEVRTDWIRKNAIFISSINLYPYSIL